MYINFLCNGKVLTESIGIDLHNKNKNGYN